MSFPPAAPPTPYGFDDVKKMIASDLNQDVSIPDGHRGANVLFANGTKIETAVATRVLQDGKLTWDVEGVISHNWTGDHANSFGVFNKITW